VRQLRAAILNGLETPTAYLDRNAGHMVAASHLRPGVSLVTSRIYSSVLGLTEFAKGRAQMSARTAVLIEGMSATWLKNALAGVAGALVLLALFIVLP
jgi:hypothetical protein